MTLSRRSFLKVAGLTAVSVAAASMFTGCGSSMLSTRVKYEAAEADKADTNVAAAVKKMNDSKSNFVLGHSDLYSNNESAAKDTIDGYLKIELKNETYKDQVEVKSIAMDQDDKGYFLKVSIGTKPADKK